MLIKCIKNDITAFVIAGHDLFAVPTLDAYYQTAKEYGADTEFLKDMNLVIQEMTDFQRQEPDRIRIPKLKVFEIEK